MNIQTSHSNDCPNLIGDYSTPKIIWYQTDSTIEMRIILVDVEKCFIKVNCDTFLFCTLRNDIKYFVGIKLCGTIIAEDTSYMLLEREIKFSLIKAHKWTDWPRLQLKKNKNPLIIFDFDHIFKKHWNNPYTNVTEKENFCEYKKRMNIHDIPPPESSSSNSDSDDENIIGYDQ